MGRPALAALAVAAAAVAAAGAAGASSAKPGVPCAAERHAGTRDVQVNCLAEDGSSRQNTQSEPSLAARGKRVVVAFNDTTLVAGGGTSGVGVGYSVSSDGGRRFEDAGGLPTRSRNWKVRALAYADPVVVAADGGFYASALAFDEHGVLGHSQIALYRMPPGKRRFRLVSTLADVGSLLGGYQADKAWLAVRSRSRRAPHRRRFFVTWSYFSPGGDLPIMLSDSYDGRRWRTRRVSGTGACDSSSQPVPGGAVTYVAWWHQDDCSENITAGSIVVARVSRRTGKVLARRKVATVHGVGDMTANCGGSVWEAIETEPGHDARLAPSPAMARDRHGTLYALWNDRPHGIGGARSNATAVYLSYSRDGRRWSRPRRISGPRSSRWMRDRFMPALVAGRRRLHATWYERVRHSPADRIRIDRRDLTLARRGRPPRLLRERALGTRAFPIVRTHPQQDPSGIPECYMGDYNGLAVAHGRALAAWGDNRNVVTTSGSREHQPDVFLRGWRR